jgi:hypothetical protein
LPTAPRVLWVELGSAHLWGPPVFSENTFRLAWDNYRLWGAVTAVLIPLWLAVLLRSRRRTVRTLREKVEDKVSGVQVADVDRMLNWLPRDGTGERRQAVRRGGPPTTIRVSRTPTNDPTLGDEGLVLDRATGGLCIATEQPFKAGDELFLRVEGAAPDFPWVAVVVRHCRDCGGYFLIGCEFQERLPLSVLLQFG